MSDQLKPTYAALPLRALQDPALSRADILALAAVSAHDRFGKNRTGCFASYLRLAAMTEMPPQSFRRCVAKLIELGYLRSEANPMDARRRILFVEFTDADAAAMRGDGRSFVKRSGLKLAPRPAESGEIGSMGATEFRGVDAARDPVENPEIGSTRATEIPKICSTEKRQAVDFVGRSECNIFCETDNRLGEALEAREKSVSAAPPEVMADAERAARDAISGRVDVGEGVARLRKALGRLKSYGDAAGERRVLGMVEAVIADAPRRAAARSGAALASPMELAAIREARERGEPPPLWVRREVRGAA